MQLWRCNPLGFKEVQVWPLGVSLRPEKVIIPHEAREAARVAVPGSFELGSVKKH